MLAAPYDETVSQFENSEDGGKLQTYLVENNDVIPKFASPNIQSGIASCPFPSVTLLRHCLYAAEKQGLRVLVSADELSTLVRIPLTGIGATQKKMEKDPDEIVRLLRALRSATLLLLEKPEYSLSLFDRILRVQPPLADKLYKLYRDQYNPELTLSDPIVEDLLAVGTFRLKEKAKTAVSLESVRDWTFADKAKR